MKNDLKNQSTAPLCLKSDAISTLYQPTSKLMEKPLCASCSNAGKRKGAAKIDKME